VTPKACDAKGERAQMILVWVRAPDVMHIFSTHDSPGGWEMLSYVGSITHARRLLCTFERESILALE
jgi:hypothetical protein